MPLRFREEGGVILDFLGKKRGIFDRTRQEGAFSKRMRAFFAPFLFSLIQIYIMAACHFSIDFTGSAEAVFSRAKAAVEKQGGSFTGDAHSGSFSLQVFGTISGTYTVAGSQLQIQINDKPMMIPCAAIESALKAQIR